MKNHNFKQVNNQLINTRNQKNCNKIADQVNCLFVTIMKKYSS